MPEHNPEDRVFVKNIIELNEDDIQTFWVTRYKKMAQVDANGQVVNKDIPYEKEIEWNFKDGFFFFWGGKVYTLKPGEQKTYYRFLAEHCAKHMVDYLINREYQASKKMGEDGIPRYNKNILNNEIVKKKLWNKIILGVEEWYGGGEDDFDTLLAKQFGGDFEEIAKETVSGEDTELPEVDQSTREAEKPVKRSVPPTDDTELAKIRDEADLIGIEYTDSDTVASLKARIIKEMA